VPAGVVTAAGPRSPAAQALAKFGSNSQRAVLAAQAGMDPVLCAAQDVTQRRPVSSALASALNSGQLDAAACNAAAGG
jgi:beta-N-acetylhexosaminidase